MATKLTAAWCEEQAADMEPVDGMPHQSADLCSCHEYGRMHAAALRIAAAALRFAEARHVAIGTAALVDGEAYAIERSNMHAAQDALLAACREAP